MTIEGPDTAGESAAAKRKLSTSAPAKDQAKKSKVDDAQPSTTPQKEVEPDAPEEQSEAPVVPKSTNVDENSEDGTKKVQGDKHDQEQKPDDNAPRKFYLWGDGVIHLLEHFVEPIFLVPKAQLDATYPRITALGETEDREGTLCDIAYEVDKIAVNFEEEAQETEEVKKLAKIYDDLPWKDGDWWYELTLQKQKPEAGRAAMELSLEGYNVGGEGVTGERGGSGNEWSTWWVTDVAKPDGESLKAIELIKDYVWDGRYPGSP